MTAPAKNGFMEQSWGMAGRVTSDSQAGHETADTNSKMLSLPSIAMTAFLTVEVVRSFASNSLALRSDAAPMVKYVLSLAIALFAIRTGCLSADDRRTFGHKRLDILPRHLTRCCASLWQSTLSSRRSSGTAGLSYPRACSSSPALACCQISCRCGG